MQFSLSLAKVNMEMQMRWSFIRGVSLRLNGIVVSAKQRTRCFDVSSTKTPSFYADV